MSPDEIVDKLADGYRLEYAPVSGGQCLSRGLSEPVIYLSFTDFDEARKDDRIRMLSNQRQGHHIFHGPVDRYGLGG